jgi:D-tyrosyl-tRNA(Tyr) deacylase
MRCVIQRVLEASVTVEGELVSAIGPGLLVLLGVEEGDGPSDLDYIVKKIPVLRIFEDDQGKMNRSVLDVGGQVLVVSQFTLLGDARKGRRPSYITAAHPDTARAYYEQAMEGIRREGAQVKGGIFMADMKVALVNDGPVTILLDSRKGF